MRSRGARRLLHIFGKLQHRHMWAVPLASLARQPRGKPDQTLHAASRADVEAKALEIKRDAETLANQANATVLERSTISCATFAPSHVPSGGFWSFSSEECPDVQRKPAESECLDAVREAAGRAGVEMQGFMKSVDEAELPFGCSYSRVSQGAIFNSHRASGARKDDQWESETYLSICGFKVGRRPLAVAVIFAMDIRLPAGGGHCKSVDDSTCDSREDILALLNGVTEGSDVFVATDRGFEEDVKGMKHVAAVRFSDESAEGEMPAIQQRQVIQWWRLREAWSLLTDYEQQCGHKYEWVFKLRTDANVIGGGRLADLPARFSTLQPNELLTFGDRWFGGPRGLMARVADLYRLYDEDNARFGRDPSQTSMHFKNVYGTCGGCELLATALFEADTSTHCTLVPLPDDAKPCQTSSRECFETAYGRPFCPLRSEEKDRLWNLTGYDVYVEHVDESRHIGEQPWPQPEAGGSHFCLFNTMKGKDYTAAPAENMFVLHLLESNIRPRRWRDSGAGLLTEVSMGLMSWRHMLHLWSDGITVDDGPLLPAESDGVARIMAEAEVGAATPQQVLMKHDRLMGLGAREDDEALAATPYLRRHDVPFRRGRARSADEAY